MPVCLRLDKSCPWLRSYAGPPFPTLSQECWRQLHTGSAKGKTQPGAASRGSDAPALAASSGFSSVLQPDWAQRLRVGAPELMPTIGLSLTTLGCELRLEGFAPPPKIKNNCLILTREMFIFLGMRADAVSVLRRER